MTLADLIKDFIDTSKERIKTPISGAFIWAFIIYNWRPIALLLFSEASIEDKIVVINYEYCNGWAIIFPIFIALFYTLLIPKIMVEINKDLAPSKKKRIENIYDDKDYTTDRKIILAKKEFKLATERSGSREVEDLLDQVASLKQTNANIIETNRNTVNHLNEKLEESNTLIQVMKDYNNNDDYDMINPNIEDFHDSQKHSEELERIKERLLTDFELKQINSLSYNIDGYIDLSNSLITNHLLNNLRTINIIIKDKKGLKFSEFGVDYLNRLNR